MGIGLTGARLVSCAFAKRLLCKITMDNKSKFAQPPLTPSIQAHIPLHPSFSSLVRRLPFPFSDLWYTAVPYPQLPFPPLPLPSHQPNRNSFTTGPPLISGFRSTQFKKYCNPTRLFSKNLFSNLLNTPFDGRSGIEDSESGKVRRRECRKEWRSE